MGKYDSKIREEELRLHVAEDWFAGFDCKRKIGNIDFCVDIPATELGLYDAVAALWAESKAGTRQDIIESFVQLILTIGRSKTIGTEHPPFFLGAFDAEKIAFLPYDAVMDVFTQNDFNWNVTPSDHATKEFRQLYELSRKTIEERSLLFDYERDESELRRFIRANFVTGRKDVSRIQITRNNFTHVYQKWRLAVLPSLAVENWDALRKDGIIDADFFLADILSDKDNRTIRKKLFVLLQSDIYEVKYGKATNGLDLISKIGFRDEQAAHRKFWNLYTRPPRKEYWDFIVERRDLLVDQDVRERKGAFFTPRQWVELSQEYLAKALGENWQDDHYVWDCCCGTGNLEAGLTNKYNVWVSTIDKADVDVIHTRIRMMEDKLAGSSNLLDSHVFQFDFLNDSFDKLPKGLKDIIDDPEKRKKLVIYINPPYAEAGNARQKCGTGENKTSVSNSTRVYERYAAAVGSSIRELFVQFYLRIAMELPGCCIGCFSTLKHVQSQNFRGFREIFRATYRCGFIVPSDTFDNVNGSFPIGFLVWQTSVETEQDDAALRIGKIDVGVFDRCGVQIGIRPFAPVEMTDFVINWLRRYYDKAGCGIGFLRIIGPDLQNNIGEFLTNTPSPNDIKKCHTVLVTKNNVFAACVYFTVRHVVEHTWENDRDQYTIPNCDVMQDGEFVSDCVAFTLFSGQNRINSGATPNHWIPYTEAEVGARDCFASHFMSDFLAGKIRPERARPQGDLFDSPEQAKIRENPCNPWLTLSPAAKAVLDAGRELWRYYHKQPDANPNASYYDIRKHFQGMKTTASGKEQMNATSADATYNGLLETLRKAMKALARQIEPKVYAYGFLRR